MKASTENGTADRALEQRVAGVKGKSTVRAVEADPSTIEDRVRSLGADMLAKIVAFVQDVTVTVVDVAGVERAVQLRSSIDSLDAEAEAFFKPIKARWFAIHRLATSRENEVRKPLADLRKKVNTAIAVFNDESTKRRQQAERETAERLQREQLERAKAEARELKKTGDIEMAKAVMAEAKAAPMPVVAIRDEVAAVEGLHFTETWHWRYLGGPNEREATPPEVLARDMELIPRQYLMPDEKKLTALAKAGKGTIRVPGVEFYSRRDPR